MKRLMKFLLGLTDRSGGRHAVRPEERTRAAPAADRAERPASCSARARRVPAARARPTWGGSATAVAEPPSFVRSRSCRAEPVGREVVDEAVVEAVTDEVVEEAAPAPKPFPDWEETGADDRRPARAHRRHAPALESELAEPFADRLRSARTRPPKKPTWPSSRPSAAEAVAEEAVVEAAVRRDRSPKRRWPRPRSPRPSPTRPCTKPRPPSRSPKTAVAEALVADDADAAGAELAAEAAIEEADAAAAGRRRSRGRGRRRRVRGRGGGRRGRSAEVVAAAAVGEAAVDEAAAEEAVQEADLAEAVAEEVAAEEAVADDVVAEAPIAGEDWVRHRDDRAGAARAELGGDSGRA